MTIASVTAEPSRFLQTITVRAHTLRADVGPDLGGEDAAPDPHDYFDAALVACKTLTATWFAKKYNLPLERVEAHVERDASLERKGTYKVSLRLAYHGPLSPADRERIHAAVEKCPIHKLMTTTEVIIETAPLESVG